MQPKYDLESYIHSSGEYAYTGRNFCCVEPGQSLIIEIEVVQPNFMEPFHRISATWLGHSSILLEYYGEAVLINPHFAKETLQPGYSQQRKMHPISLK